MAQCDLQLTVVGEGAEDIAELAGKVCEAFTQAMEECSDEVHYKFLGTCLVLAGLANQNNDSLDARSEVLGIIKRRFNVGD